MRGLLPAAATAVETYEDLVVDLFPAEEAALGQAVDKRRREFVAGRACARKALAELGADPVAIGSGPHGEPLWPEGVVGSITHSHGYRACAVAWQGEVEGLGIDAERDAPLDAGVWDQVAHGDERELRDADGAVNLDAVVFSAKEALYKAWFPLTGRRLEFADVRVSIDPHAGSFRTRLLMPGPRVLTDVCGRWSAGNGLVMTAIAV